MTATRTSEKTNRFNEQNNNFACAALHDYGMKLPNFAFYGEREQAMTNFFVLSELGHCLFEFNFRRVCLHFTK